jgi:hypothetical protein
MPSREEKSREEGRGEARAREEEEPEAEALQWLAKHGCYVTPGNGYHRQLITTVERHGVNAVVGWLDRLSEAGVNDGDTKGFVFGAIDALNPRPDLRALEHEERSEEDARIREERFRQDYAERAEMRKAMGYEA